jgi:hypothetical protein
MAMAGVLYAGRVEGLLRDRTRPVGDLAFRSQGNRADVIGIFPNTAAVIRLVGALMLEQNVSGWCRAAI